MRRSLGKFERPVILCMVVVAAVSCAPGDVGRLDEARGLVGDADEAFATAAGMTSPEEQASAAEMLGEARGMLRDARDLYLRAKADQSDDPEVLREFAELAVRTEDFDLAGKAYRRAAENADAPAELWLEAGRNFVKVGVGMGDPALDALTQCRELAQANGDEVLAARANTQLGHLYRTLGLYEIAREHYVAGLSTEMQFFDAHLGLAGLNFREGRVVEAAAAMDRFGSMQGTDLVFLDAMLRFGYVGFRENRVSFQDTAANHLSYGKLLTRLQRLNEALTAVRRATELDDQDVIALNLLGSLARAAGDNVLSRDAFEQSLRLNADQPRTLQVLNDLKSAESAE